MSAYRVITAPLSDVFGNPMEEEVEFDFIRTLSNSIEIVWDKTLYDEFFNEEIKKFVSTGNNEDELRDELLEQYSNDVFESFKPD